MIRLLIGLKCLSGIAEGVNKEFICPFDGERCSFPDGEHFRSEDFVGCKITDYDYGGDGSKVFWVCPRFPLNLSTTTVRDAFTRLRFEEKER